MFTATVSHGNASCACLRPNKHAKCISFLIKRAAQNCGRNLEIDIVYVHVGSLFPSSCLRIATFTATNHMHRILTQQEKCSLHSATAGQKLCKVS